MHMVRACPAAGHTGSAHHTPADTRRRRPSAGAADSRAARQRPRDLLAAGPGAAAWGVAAHRGTLRLRQVELAACAGGSMAPGVHTELSRPVAVHVLEHDNRALECCAKGLRQREPRTFAGIIYRIRTCCTSKSSKFQKAAPARVGPLASPQPQAKTTGQTETSASGSVHA